MEVGKWHNVGKKVVGERNRKNIEKWFYENPGKTISECSRALNLNWQTVKKHVVAIQKGE